MSTLAAILRPPRRPVGPLGWAALAVAGVFLLPIVTVAAHLLLPTQGTWLHLVHTVLPDYLVQTGLLVLMVALGVLALGTGAAWLVVAYRFPGRRLMEWALILPMAVPAYVLAYTYTDFLQSSGPVQTFVRNATGLDYGEYWFPEIRSLGGAAAMLVLVLYPYVYLLARASFLEQSAGVLEVGRTLGCGSLASFFRLELPLARPAIVAGMALAGMETLADYGTVSFFGVQTFTTGIYRAWFSLGDRVAAAQLASVLLAFVLLVLLAERTSRAGARYHQTTRRRTPPAGRRLEGWRAALALAGCLLPVTLGFLLPAALLLDMSLVEGDAQFGAIYLKLARHSFTLAAVTALAAVLLAVLLAYAARLRPSRITRAATRIAGSGYAVPGSVIAVGTLIPLAWTDNAVDGWMRAHLGVSTGLLLTGSIAALVFAYLVRFLAIALQTVEASLAKVTPSMDDAARSLGYGPGPTLARVHVPIMRGSLVTAGLLVFVDTMKELPATLIMRPFDFDTLAVQAYNLAKDERLSEASTASLAIVAVGLVPVLLMSRSLVRRDPPRAG